MKVTLYGPPGKKLRFNDSTQTASGSRTTGNAATGNPPSGQANAVPYPAIPANNGTGSLPDSSDEPWYKNIAVRVIAGLVGLAVIVAGVASARGRDNISSGTSSRGSKGSGTYVAKDGTRHNTWEDVNSYENKQKEEKQTSTALAIWKGKIQYKEIDAKDEWEVRDLIKATGISSNGIVKHEWGDRFSIPHIDPQYIPILLEMSRYASSNFDSSFMIRFDKVDLAIGQLAELVPAIVNCSENLPNSDGKYVGEVSKPFKFRSIKRSDLSNNLSDAIATLGNLQKKFGFDEGVYISEYDLDKALGEMWIHFIEDERVQNLVYDLEDYFKLAKSKISIDLSKSIFESIRSAKLRYFEIPVATDRSFDSKWALESSLDAFCNLLKLQHSFSWSDKLSNSVYSTDKKTKKVCLDIVQQNAYRFIACLRQGKANKLSQWAKDGNRELNNMDPANMKNFILLPTPGDLDMWYPDSNGGSIAGSGGGLSLI